MHGFAQQGVLQSKTSVNADQITPASFDLSLHRSLAAMVGNFKAGLRGRSRALRITCLPALLQ